MIDRSNLSLPLHLRSATALAALICCSAAVQAQSSPWYIGASQRFAHESNVTLAADGAPGGSATVSTTSLLAGFDQPISRQRVTGSLSVQDNRYSGTHGVAGSVDPVDNSIFNNTSYGANLGLDWATIDRISGTVKLGANQSLARFSPGDAPALTTRNVQTNRFGSASVRVGAVTRLTVEAEISHYELDYSAAEFNFREQRQDAAYAGLRYAFSGALSAGVGVRAVRGSYPRYAESTTTLGDFVPDKFSSNQLDLSTEWIPTGSSKFNARIGVGKQKHTVATDLNTSGLTGSVAWAWTPGGRLRLNTSLTRDQGQSLQLLPALGTTGELDSSRMTTALRVAANYDLTGKIVLTGSVGHARRSLSNSFAVGDGPSAGSNGDDRTNSLALGARWTPLRSVAVNCDLTHERRSVSGTLSQPYSANTFGCAVQAILQ